MAEINDEPGRFDAYAAWLAHIRASMPGYTTTSGPPAIRITMRLATPEEVEWARPGAAKDGVNLEPSDEARPTTWWIAETPRGHRLGICGMMPVEDGGQRLRGAWVVPAWRRLGVWWTMLEWRLAEAVPQCKHCLRQLSA